MRSAQYSYIEFQILIYDKRGLKKILEIVYSKINY